ncbi:unnamed protein product [Diatraea saccharalis]|uniref:FP protein C-terminal domain-containing protein n=1 Tax=Diatraea saccharalis TaxID=40085 RepID=A0A9N9RES4_9NEOP|nr:unnamed protein product [Diatraea saccharalis]
MMRTPEKSCSFPDMANMDSDSSLSYAMLRNKRKRSDDIINNLEDVKNELKFEIKSLFEEFSLAQKDQTNTIITTLKDIQHTNSHLNNTITFLCEENSELRKKIEQLEIESRKDKEQIILLENKFEENLRTEKKSNIEIKNVPLKGDEKKKDLLNMVLLLSKKLELDIKQTEVKDIMKLNKNKNQQNTTLVVEFNSTLIKNDFIRASKLYNNKNKNNKLSSKHLGIGSNPDIQIFVSENLTPKAARLFYLARDLKTVKHYKYCWTNFGKVYIRHDDSSPIINITSESQVQQLLNK